MLYTYAIEPEALATCDRCRLLLNLMGFQHGRVIAAYPTRKRWKALVRAACRENGKLGDRDRQRILRKLDQSNGKLVSSDAEYDDGLEPANERWIRNAVGRQTAESVFHAILATRNPTNHPDVVLDEDVDESHDRFDVPRELPVLRHAKELAAHIATLVVNSREMLLVDPHLDLSKDKWRPVVAACLDHLCIIPVRTCIEVVAAGRTGIPVRRPHGWRRRLPVTASRTPPSRHSRHPVS